MKHFTDILIEKGYLPYRCSCVFPNQNTSAKSQNDLILNNKEKYKVIFTSGDEKNGTFFFKSKQPYYDFSTMRVGGVSTFWIKDNDFKNAIVWGLNTIGKPPTLITPRPEVKIKKINQDNEIYYLNKYDDDAINYLLSSEDSLIIYNAIVNKNRDFYFDLT